MSSSPGRGAPPAANRNEGHDQASRQDTPDLSIVARGAAISGERCVECTELATRTLGALPYCGPHAEAILEPIRNRVIERESLEGIGRRRPCGVNRPEYGRGVIELACVGCGATWCGPDGEACPWCDERRERALRQQRDLVLHPDLPDPADRRYDDALRAWANRLAVAVRAEVISDTEAHRAWDREVAITDAA